MVGCTVRLSLSTGAVACNVEKGWSAEGLLNMCALFSDASYLAWPSSVWSKSGLCCREETVSRNQYSSQLL